MIELQLISSFMLIALQVKAIVHGKALSLHVQPHLNADVLQKFYQIFILLSRSIYPEKYAAMLKLCVPDIGFDNKRLLAQEGSTP